MQNRAFFFVLGSRYSVIPVDINDGKRESGSLVKNKGEIEFNSESKYQCQLRI